MRHILIATPTAGGVVKSLFVTTLLKTVKAIQNSGWDFDFITVDGSYISRSRNYFAHCFLNSSNITDLLMIDSDMSFEADVISRLLRCGKPFAAAAYSQRRMDLRTFAEVARNSDLEVADLSALALEYNIIPELETGTRQLRVIDGMCRVSQVALGCAVIRRDAFEDLISAGLVRRRPDRFLERGGTRGPFYGFFDEITLDDGDVLSEDYSFCKRYRQLPDNEIWAIVDQPIGHVGDMIYGAPYINRLLLKGKPRPANSHQLQVADHDQRWSPLT